MQYLEVSDLELEEIRKGHKDQIDLMGIVNTIDTGSLLLISNLDSLENEMVDVEEVWHDLTARQTTLMIKY